MDNDLRDAGAMIELASFVPAAPSRQGEDDPERRFTRLLARSDTQRHEGATSTVMRVENASGEVFALKVLRPSRADAGSPFARAREEAFLEEYRNQTVVSGLRGFPRVFGFGRADGNPCILMEWVEGSSLHQVEAERDLPWDARLVARLGLAVFSILCRTENLDRSFAHRDLSPRNIILRSSQTSVEEQLETGDFDVCLVDLGSSAALSEQDGSFTMLADVWRNGTPDYAPPEMLTRDVPGIDELRHSDRVDVYALCSVLYELYSGKTPFSVSEHPEASPYRLKMDNDPAPLEPRSKGDAVLRSALMAGLARDPERRPTVTVLRDVLEAWLDGKAETAERLLMPFGEKDVATRGNKGGISRRTLITGAAVAVAGVGIAAAATAIGLSSRRSRTFPDLSWDDLSEISAEIADAGGEDAALEVARRYGICSVDGTIIRSRAMSFELGGESVSAQVAGIAHDVRTDGTPIGLTFLLANPLLEERPMSDEPFMGGWEDSGLRAWMGSELLDLLPEELARNLVSASKLTNNAGAAEDASAVSATEDLLWIPSYCELVGTREPTSFSEGFHFLADVLNAEGKQYKLFRDQGVLPRGDYSALVRKPEGSEGYRWLRSPSPDVSLSEGCAYFNRVAPNGDPFHYAVESTTASGVLFGFCV